MSRVARLTDEKKGLLVKLLIEKNLYQAGLDFELDKFFATTVAVRNAVYRYYNEVSKDPERYGLTREKLDEVAKALASRTIHAANNRQSSMVSLREKHEAEANKDMKDLVLEGSKKALQILTRKMERIGRSNASIDDTNLATLASTFGILFDKAQIVKGQATENVAILAKIDTSKLSPEEALSTVLKMREANQADKEKSKK